MKKKIILPVIMATVIGVSILSATPAHAQTNDGSPFPSLIQKIVEKFGLEQADVEAVFQEHRNQMHAQMQQRMETRLNESVTNGTITEEQKQLVLKKHEEMQAEREKNRDTWQNMTQEERKAEHEKRQAEMKSWAEKNGINLDLFFGFKGGRGFGHGFAK